MKIITHSVKDGKREIQFQIIKIGWGSFSDSKNSGDLLMKSFCPGLNESQD